MTGGRGPSGRSMPGWWKALLVAGAVLLAGGLVVGAWPDDPGPPPISGVAD